MKRTKTSKAWMNEHVHDTYVQRAKTEGYRSRAAFKLLEIDDRDHILRSGMTVVDLGAAPGSWCQVVMQRIGADKGRLFALDLLPVEAVTGMTFIQGDFLEDRILRELTAQLHGEPVDVVLSDMAPNMSGIALSDQARSVHLAELALDFAIEYLKPGGSFLVKVFQGQGFAAFRQAAQRHFQTLHVRKPKASRDRSPEVYLLGTGRKAV